MQQKRAIPRISAASRKFRGNRRIPQCSVKICIPWNTAGPVITSENKTWQN